MKTQNKILVIILIIILALIMMPIVSNASTLTISNSTPTSGSSIYGVYEILSKTENGEYALTTNAASYFASNVTATVNNGTAKNLTTVDEVLEYLTDLASSASTSEGTNPVTYSPATKEAFATDYREKVTVDRTVDTKDTNGQIADVENGYYLIYDTNGDPRSQNMLVEVTKDTTINVKATGITMEKEVTNGDSHYIGENLEFTIKTVVPNMSGYSAYTFKVSDEATNLKMVAGSVTVSIGGTTISLATDKITVTDTTITVDLGDYLLANKASLTVGSEILVKYKAELTYSALDSSVAKNDAKITYSNDPNTTSTGTVTPSTGTENVYTYSVTVNKKSTLGKALTGATFVVKTSDGKYINVDSTTKAISLVDSESNATVYTGGTFKVEGLKEGTYELVETKAPEGYSTVSGLIFTIANNDNSTIGTPEPQTVTHTLSKGTNASGNIEIVESSNLEKFELNVIDSKTTILPTTGGIGTTIFTVVYELN